MSDILSYTIPDCTFYKPQFRVGFHYWEFQKGTIMRGVDNNENHLLFVMEGEVTLTLNEYRNRIIHEKEMIYLPLGSNYTGCALTDIKILMLTYGRNSPACTREHLHNITKLKSSYTYECKGLTMKEPVEMLARQIVFYLLNGLNCNHFHEIKQNELFLVLKRFYKPDEILSLFYLSLFSNTKFSEAVMGNYLKVKTAEELAEMLGYSPKVFGRLFKKHFGSTPYQWMQQQKAQHIKGRLMDNSVPLKHIIDEFQFAGSAHFNAYCHRYFGATPSDIRRQYDNKE